ncbi:unnamed protein product [Musa acuminata subsp. malaccensis]|uniref:(wild Malaysian banana) hypothetical protein n=1 Tax=Musa acuminata subsp. malaccensis TaxID=214687 RepID=A0A804J958_MUSAM|nr:PREDICTED: uncharacterized protein At3g27210-like isoform X1 [Musa acuminata subsp. malaccensis]CAG1839980.1 unnamed protein product [Musa acuminata subsp. malaccensis]
MLGDDKDLILKMGSCSSVDRDTDSTIRYRLGVNHKGRRLFIPSPAKEKPFDGKKPFGEVGSMSPESAVNKEDIYFDSCAWLDSDCEDDFFSVKGEFTPSQGSTPIHQSSAPLTPRPVNSIYIDKSPETSSEPSPTGRKKLRELFQETLLVEREGSEPNAAEVETNKRINLHTTNTDPPPRQLNGTPYRFRAISFCSSTVTSSGDPKNRKERLCKSQHCCLPSLQSFGLDDRRQKMTTKHCTA